MLKKNCFLFFTRSISSENVSLISELAANVKDQADFYVLSYQESGFASQNEQSDFAHTRIDRNNLKVSFREYVRKYSDSIHWHLMPGNTDLPLLHFYLNHLSYDYYWLCEDDVRYTGSVAQVISRFQDDATDLLCANIRAMPESWGHRKTLFIDGRQVITDESTLIAFFPFFRASNRFLSSVHNAYRNGAAGHYEIVWPKIAQLQGLSVKDWNSSGKALYTSNLQSPNLGPGTFIFFPPKIAAGKRPDTLYHPVKNRAAYMASWRSYLRHRARHYGLMFGYYRRKFFGPS